MWFTIFSFSTISLPNLEIISSLVVGLWKPVAIRIVISASGFPFLISSSKIGRVIADGTGLVWSDVIRVILFLPLAKSLSLSESIGFSRASFTKSSWLLAALYI